MFHTSKKVSSRRTQLGLESLNSRIVPAVVLTTADLDGDGATDDIRIVGDGQSSKISFVDNGSSQVHVQIDANGDGDYTDTKLGDLDTNFNFTGDSFVLDVQLKGGNDQLAYVSTVGMNNSARSVTADMGGGNDTFFWIQNNPIGGVSRISLDIFGGGGKDAVTVDFGNVDHSVISVRTDLGNGNDTYDLTFGEVDSEASIDVHTDLGAGTNTHTVDLDGVGKFDQATMNMTIIGGAQKDTVTLIARDDVGNQTLTSQLNVFVDLLGGNDVFKGQLLGGDFKVDNNSQASFVVRGGAGNDSLSFERLGSGLIEIDAKAICLIDLDGGAGNDIISADFGGVDAWQLELDSILKIRLDGGLGKDIIACLLTNDAQTVGSYDVAVHGGAGDDTITFATNNNGGTPLYGPAGGIILDGGAGKDILGNGNPAITLGTTFETVL